MTQETSFICAFCKKSFSRLTTSRWKVCSDACARARDNARRPSRAKPRAPAIVAAEAAAEARAAAVLKKLRTPLTTEEIAKVYEVKHRLVEVWLRKIIGKCKVSCVTLGVDYEDFVAGLYNVAGETWKKSA